MTCTACAGQGKNIRSDGKGVRSCQTCGGAGSIPLARCSFCYGSGKIQYTKEINVQSPSGIATGQQIRVAGQGTPGHPPGNLFCNIKVATNKLFWRDGNDIHTTKRISLKHAICGGPITFAGANGLVVSLQIPPGTQPGDVVNVQGSGVTGALSKVAGDLIVHVEVLLPKNISPRAKKLLDELMDELSRGPQGNL